MALCRHPDLPADQTADLINPDAHPGWVLVDSTESPKPDRKPAKPAAKE